MADFKIPLKTKDYNLTKGSKPGVFQKLARNCNFSFRETFRVRSDKRPNYSVDEVTDIGALFIPIVKYLRIIGFCPFTIRQDPATGFVVYEFKWKSWLTVYSICFSGLFGLFACFIFSCITWTSFSHDFIEVLHFQGIQIPSQHNGYTNMSFVSKLGTRMVPTTFPMLSCISVFGTLASLPKFQVILNAWSSFQQEYIRTFHWRKCDAFVHLRKYRNTVFPVYIVFGFIATSVVFSVFNNLWGRIAVGIFPLVGWPKFTATFTMLIMVGCHGIHFLLFRTLMEAFKQIHVGIIIYWKDFQNDLNEHDFILLQENVKKWTNLVVLVKKQVEYTGQAMAFHQVALILVNFTFLCLGVFSCLSSKSGPEEGNRGYILLMFCTWGFSLLTVKAFMCERILEQEKLIVTTLRQLEAGSCLASLIQINALIDLIIREPAVVRFWNVMTINKAFLVQLLGQVATYLIVLIQLNNMD